MGEKTSEQGRAADEPKKPGARPPRRGQASTGKPSGSRRFGRDGRGTDHQEVEWQFDAEDLDRVEGWLGEKASGSGLVVGPGSAQDLVDVYYDTGDWRLYRAGYALRVRETEDGAEATMKALAPAEGGLRRRRELSEPLKDGKAGSLRRAGGPVGERLRLLVGDREVGRIFEVRTNRKTFALGVADGTGGVVRDASGDVRGASGGEGAGDVQVGEVVIDSTRIPLGEGGESAGLWRVEVEVEAGGASDPRVLGFVREMEGGSLGLRPARTSKYEAGLFATGARPEGREELGPTEVDASLSLGEMAFAVLRREFAAMRAHEPGARLGEDPEELHDMRVATRRVRAAMKLFEDALPERSRWLREELRHFAGVLGDVRDLDVQIGEFEGVAGDGDREEDDEALAVAVEVLKKRRGETRGRMLQALDSERYARFESSFAEMLRRGPEVARAPEAVRVGGSSTKSAARTPVLEAAPGLLGRCYRKWRKAARRLDGDSRPEEYHDLRKKGKRLRYALEFFSGVYGEEATGALVGPLKSVQDSLGRHQDVIVAAGLLREIAVGTPRLPKRRVFGLGLLAQRYRAEAVDLRASSVAAEEYRALVAGKAWKGFEKLVKKRREGKKGG